MHYCSSGWMRPRSRATVRLLLLIGCIVLTPAPSRAQSRLGADSTTRMARYLRDLEYGAAEGFAYAGVDQLRNSPSEWGKGWRGYGKRLASNEGEFVIQETVTDVLAAMMNRQLDYMHCNCRGTGRKIGWVLQSAVTDPLPDGHRVLAVPRIIGAYAGSFAQATWRPATSTSRTRTALVNGTVSLLIGAAINLYYEVR